MTNFNAENGVKKILIGLSKRLYQPRKSKNFNKALLINKKVLCNFFPATSDESSN
jgi:hypothetical protein